MDIPGMLWHNITGMGGTNSSGLSTVGPKRKNLLTDHTSLFSESSVSLFSENEAYLFSGNRHS